MAVGSRTCFTKPSLTFVLVSVPLLVLSSFLGVWFLPFLVTISVLVLSSALHVTFTKKKVVLDGNPDPVQNVEPMSCSSKNVPEVEIDAPCSDVLRSETGPLALQQNVTYQVKGDQILHEYAFKSHEVEIEMESGSDDEDDLIRSQNLGFNWFHASNVDEESTETSDDSISATSEDEDDDEEDDDSLIEIALPCEESKQKLQPNSPEDLEELLEEINEMNEEDNLIEIDISKFNLYELDVKSQVF